jgi:hypothetical protein
MELASLSGRKGGTHTALPEPSFVRFVSEDDMNYQRIYTEFIADRREKESGLVGYTEKHHITTRSMGGSDDKDNLIKLTAGDHFFAHLLLAKAHGGKQWAALWAISGMDNDGLRKKDFAWALKQRKWVSLAREKSSQIQKEINSNPEVKAKFTERVVNMWKDDKFKTKTSETMRLVCQKPDVKAKRSLASIRRWQDPEIRTRNLEAIRIAQQTPEYKEKMRIAGKKMSGGQNPSAKKVICLDTGAIYATMKDAALDTGALDTSICVVCKKGRLKTAGGLRWAYYQENQ